MRSTYWWLGIGALGGLLQVCGGVLETVDRVLPGEAGYELRTGAMGIAYLLFLAPLLGLWRSGAADAGRPARFGLAIAGAGWALYALAQFVLQVDYLLAERLLFPIGTVLIGVGMITAGVLVIRVRRVTGWRRVIPLVCGLYPFVVIFPSFAVAGGPNFLALSGWGLCWIVLAVSLARRS